MEDFGSQIPAAGGPEEPDAGHSLCDRGEIIKVVEVVRGGGLQNCCPHPSPALSFHSFFLLQSRASKRKTSRKSSLNLLPFRINWLEVSKQKGRHLYYFVFNLQPKQEATAAKMCPLFTCRLRLTLAQLLAWDLKFSLGRREVQVQPKQTIKQ